MDARDREMLIEQRIRATYDARGSIIFWPDQFVDAKLGTEEEVVAALMELASRERLEPTVEVRADDHLCWSGSPEEFAKLRPFTCKDVACLEYFDKPAEHATVSFRMSKKWRDVIGAEKKNSEAWAP